MNVISVSLCVCVHESVTLCSSYNSYLRLIIVLVQAARLAQVVIICILPTIKQTTTKKRTVLLNKDSIPIVLYNQDQDF